jgi:hypothetical protein
MVGFGLLKPVRFEGMQEKLLEQLYIISICKCYTGENLEVRVYGVVSMPLGIIRGSIGCCIGWLVVPLKELLGVTIPL